MGQNTALLLLLAGGLFLLSRSSAGAAGAGGVLGAPLIDYIPPSEPAYGTPEGLFPFDYSTPTNTLPIAYT
jgi:hypothetical protein